MAENPMAIIYMHRKSPVPQLPESQAALQPLLHKLLAKQPADRFESARVGRRGHRRGAGRTAGPGAGGMNAPRARPLPEQILRAATPRGLGRGCVRALAGTAGGSSGVREESGLHGTGADFRLPGRHGLTQALSRLAREELRHFEQVQALMRELAVPYARAKPGRYAAGLRALSRTSEPHRKLDLLLTGALIEARSAERFARLTPRLPAPLARFYAQLERSEARHFQLYLRLAIAGGAGGRAQLARAAECSGTPRSAAGHRAG